MRPLGFNQEQWLRSVCEFGEWHKYSGYHWDNYSGTVRLCESLERRGYLRSEMRDIEWCNSTIRERVWVPTEAAKLRQE